MSEFGSLAKAVRREEAAAAASRPPPLLRRDDLWNIKKNATAIIDKMATFEGSSTDQSGQLLQHFPFLHCYS